jgi:hypothetical protein
MDEIQDVTTWKHPIKKRDENDGLPPGVNREMSPFWDMQRNPIMLVGHMLRYMHMTATVAYLTQWEKRQNRRYQIWDICSGMCEMFPFLAATRKAKGVQMDYIGFDIDEWKIERAMAYLGQRKGFDILIGDITKKKSWVRWKSANHLMSDGPADIVICSETLEHITKKAGEILMRRLKRYGVKYMIGTVPTPSYAGKQTEKGWHVHEYATDELVETFERNGWTRQFVGHTQARWKAVDYSPYLHKDVVKQVVGFPIRGHSDTVKGSVTYFVFRNDDVEIEPPF